MRVIFDNDDEFISFVNEYTMIHKLLPNVFKRALEYGDITGTMHQLIKGAKSANFSHPEDKKALEDLVKELKKLQDKFS